MDTREGVFRVLALEGGGPPTLDCLPLLAHIEQAALAGGPAAGAFDLIAGTCGGALIAAGLAAGATAAGVAEFARRDLPAAFRPSGFWNWPLFDAGDPGRVCAALRRWLGGLVGTPDPTWADLAAGAAGRAEVVVTLWDRSRGEARFVSTDLADGHPLHATGLHGAAAAEVVSAALSAPGLLSPRAFYRRGDGGHVGTFGNGCAAGLSNPGLLAAGLACRRRPTPAEVQVVALGAGWPADAGRPRRRTALAAGRDAFAGGAAASAGLMARMPEAFAPDRAWKYLRADLPPSPRGGRGFDPGRPRECEALFRGGEARYALCTRDGVGSPVTTAGGKFTPAEAGRLFREVFTVGPVAPAAPGRPRLDVEPVRSEGLRPGVCRRVAIGGLLLTSPALLAAAIGSSAAALWAWGEADDWRSRAGRWRGDAESRAAAHLRRVEREYAEPAKLAGWLTALPPAGDKFPFDDAAANRRRRDRLIRLLRDEFPARGPEMRAARADLQERLAEWPAAGRPGGWLYEAALRFAELLRGQLMPAARRALGVPSPVLGRRREAYRQARRAVADLAAAARLTGLEARTAYLVFWDMYWGRLPLLGTAEVNRAADGVKSELRTWAAKGVKPAAFAAAARAFGGVTAFPAG